MRTRKPPVPCWIAALVLGLFSPADGAGIERHSFLEPHPFLERHPLLERLEAPGGTPLRNYRALRQLSASTRRGTMRGDLAAWTTVEDGNRMTFDIVNEVGSGAIRRRVLVAALEGERELLRTGEAAQGGITTLNYEFPSFVEVSSDLVRLDIRPRRRHAMLVNGSILVDAATADVLAIEGLLSKRPSFWTRRVRIERRYARIAGVRVPISMTSSADVFIVGQSSFAMTYCYEVINDATVGRCALTAPATRGDSPAER